MVVQYYFPQSLSPARFDRYLASGWFRSAAMLYRLQLICMEGDYYSLVNIRLKLENYHFKKRLRRILRRNQQRFYTVIRKGSITPAKERLYQQQKHRFKGFVFDTLLEFLEADMQRNIFDTFEVCVYDGNKLVAVSYFDMGKQSIASLIGLYNQSEEYRKFSLGLFTMLMEIDYAIVTNKKYYYPGYVLDRESEFDYKLRLGTFEYYNWKGRWCPMGKFPDERMTSHLVREKISNIKQCLTEKGINFKQWLYPFFSVSYLESRTQDLVRSIVLIQCFPEQNIQNLIIEYIVEEDYYVLSRISVESKYREMLEMNFSHDLLQPNIYWLELLNYERIIYKHANPQKIVDVVDWYRG